MGIARQSGEPVTRCAPRTFSAWQQRFHPAARLSTFRLWCHFFAYLFEILMFDSQAVTGYLSGPRQKGHAVIGPS